jgi:hypothetical protein
MSNEDTINSVDMMKIVKSFVDRGVAGEYHTTLVQNYQGEVIDLRRPPAPLDYKWVQQFVGKQTYWVTVIPRGCTADGIPAGDLWQQAPEPLYKAEHGAPCPRTESTSSRKLPLLLLSLG